jgi:putative endonuclease
MRNHTYFVYLLTNKTKRVLYIGVTNDLSIRLKQHVDRVNSLSFTSRYNCFYLVYFETYKYVDDAIYREKEIKGWSRAKKNALIETENKEWRFLNEDILEDY